MLVKSLVQIVLFKVFSSCLCVCVCVIMCLCVRNTDGKESMSVNGGADFLGSSLRLLDLAGQLSHLHILIFFYVLLTLLIIYMYECTHEKAVVLHHHSILSLYADGKWT